MLAPGRWLVKINCLCAITLMIMLMLYVRGMIGVCSTSFDMKMPTK